MTLLSDLAGYIADEIPGTFVENSTLFIGAQPDYPDSCVTLYEYGGDPYDLSLNMTFAAVQVRARSNSYDVGRAMLDAVKALLHRDGEVTIGSVRYVYFNAIQPPTMLGRDAKGRFEWTQNYRVVVDG